MAKTRSEQDCEATARLAAAYLDMWEAIATAHAQKGPPMATDDVTSGEEVEGDKRG